MSEITHHTYFTHQTSDIRTSWQQMSDIWRKMYDIKHQIYVRHQTSYIYWKSDVWQQTLDMRRLMSDIKHILHINRVTSAIKHLKSLIRRLIYNIRHQTYRKSDVWQETSDIRYLSSDNCHLTADIWDKKSYVVEIRCLTADIGHQTSAI